MLFLITLFALLLVVAGMSIGVLMGRKPITGSCGGVGKALGDPNYVCELCGGDESKCEEKQQGKTVATAKAKNLSYEVK